MFRRMVVLIDAFSLATNRVIFRPSVCVCVCVCVCVFEIEIEMVSNPDSLAYFHDKCVPFNDLELSKLVLLC